MSPSPHDTSPHDTKIVEQFTRWAQPFADLPIHSEADGLARTLDAAAIEPHMSVLDVACGPGIVACAAARNASHVTGIDLTPAMIDQAQKRQRALGLGNLDWHVGNACALPFNEGAFDIVLTRYSFHHLPDAIVALREMKRVCRAGGRLVVIDATPSPQSQAAYDRMEILRDPSHTSALTLEQLRIMGREVGLSEQHIDGYRLEAELNSLADPDDMQKLTQMLDSDIASGQNHTGVAAQRRESGIWIYFPISILAWRTPG
jgi:SAM-dependent methyltransferase